MKKKSFIRLFVDFPLEVGKVLPLSDAQSHYLIHVMKLKINDNVLVFDGQNGEFLAFVTQISKKEVILSVLEKTRAFCSCPDIWLLFAPLKKDQTDFVVQKATELGVSKLVIVPAERSVTKLDAKRLEKRLSQWKNTVQSACEQCARSLIPNVQYCDQLQIALIENKSERNLVLAPAAQKSFYLGNSLSVTFAVGPEGGFSAQEIELANTLGYESALLGPRVLRTETAGLAALAVAQSQCGDFR